MDLDITNLLAQYASAEPRRSAGGIHAMAGFAFQARVYVAELAEALAGSNGDLRSKGNVFVEALSDIAKWEAAQDLVLLQVKRTLTPSTLESAADEIAAIEAFISATVPEFKGTLKFGVISAFTGGATQWTDLPKGSLHQSLIQTLDSQGRLLPPRTEQDPFWRTVTAVWPHIGDPYSFARFAFERVLLRRIDPGDARECRDAIAERFAASRHLDARAGQVLSPADFAPAMQVQHFRLEVGRQVTLARVRAGQYMPRGTRVEMLAQRAVALGDLAQHSPEAAVRVFWLSGRSGVGKSVLLLQLLERLVSRGRRVLWLGGDASLLDRALRDVEALPAHEAPEFIGVDDLYDRDAREQLELAKLASYIDERGRRSWPLIITCGPTEFAEAFMDATRFRGFEVTAEPISPVDGREAADVLDWVSARRGSAASGLGEAFAQAQEGQGLFVSMATELEFGDLKEFGARFCERLSAAALREPLRPLLALNRLYLRAPYRWLGESEREKLEGLNRDGDFSLLELQPGSRLVRLTHPHMSDAIYRALVRPQTPLAYANDLALAFERALDDGDDALAARLLRTFSTSDRSLLADRLVDVNMQALAERCVSKWQALPPGGDRRIQSDIAISWACWHASHKSLGRSADELIHAALDTMDLWRDSDLRQSHWPAFWWRLWRSYPNAQLATWAELRISSDSGLKIPQWSRIWETLVDGFPAAQGISRELASVAERWLACSHGRADWHFVWKKLRRQTSIAQEASRRLALDELELPAAPCWAFVFQDMLAMAKQSASNVELHTLIAKGCSWLTGRGDRAEWSFVLQSLLEVAEDVDQEAQLVSAGMAWLPSREDRPEYAFVLQKLLDVADESEQRAQLVSTGLAWLPNREDRPEWSYVLQKLLDVVDDAEQRAKLVLVGMTWLSGREDRPEWDFVLQKLLNAAENADQRAQLVSAGLAWLPSREYRPGWNFVLQKLLDTAENADQRAQLVSTGLAWLPRREDRQEWKFVLQKLLDAAENADQRAQLVSAGLAWLPSHANRPGWDFVLQKLLEVVDDAAQRAKLVLVGMTWLAGREDRPEWNFVLQKLLDAAENTDQRAQLVSAGLAWLPSREDRPEWNFVLQKLLDAAENADQRAQLVSAGLAWLPSREDRPEWSFVLQALLDVVEATDQRAQLVSAGMAWLPNQAERPGWAFVLQKLLDVAEDGEQRTQLVSAGFEFILEQEDRAEWSFVFGRLLEVAKDLHTLHWKLICAAGEQEARRRARKFLKERRFNQLTASAILTELLDVFDPRLRSWTAVVDLVTDREMDHDARTILTGIVENRLSNTRDEEFRSCLGVTLSKLRRQVEQPYVEGEMVSGVATAIQSYGLFINTPVGEVLLPISRIPVWLLPQFMISVQVGHTQQVRLDEWDKTRNIWKVSHPEYIQPSGAGPDLPAAEIVEARVIWVTKNSAFLDINGLAGVLHKSKTLDRETLKTWPANETRCVRVVSWDATTTRWILADSNYEPSSPANDCGN